MARILNNKQVDEMCSKMTVGQRLKFVRTMRGLTQRELGELSGINHNNIGSYEREIREPSFFAITCIADALEVSLDWLANRGSNRWQGLN